MKLSRIECESEILKKLKEIVDIYHQYNPDGTYLSMTYMDNHISMFNCVHDNNKGTVDAWMDLDEDADKAYGHVFSEGGVISHVIQFDIRDATLME